MRTTTTAAELNAMIQGHIDARVGGEYPWHTAVYLQAPNAAGCNWNIEVNCNCDSPACGAIISRYIDGMRGAYVIPSDDVTAVPAYGTSVSSRPRGPTAGVSPGVPA